jgi:2-(1,2-epoxy-1,2-dihydrophenyl)acetyl-CoA isomerase
MSFKYIKNIIKENISIITLNRPEVLNSFNMEMAVELQSILDSVRKDDSIRAVVITGEGKAFCAGQDLGEVTGKILDPGEIVEKSYNPIIRRIRNIKLPFIAAVNGVAAGAGANIALASDFVFASSSAYFIQSFSKIGLIPDSGGTFFLPRLIGIARASALMMTGDKISATDAVSLGMIYKTTEPEELLKEAVEMAHKLSEMPSKAIGMIKELINSSFSNNLDSQLELEKTAQRLAGQTEDYFEGVKAFIEKRKPVYKGK